MGLCAEFSEPLVISESSSLRQLLRLGVGIFEQDKGTESKPAEWKTAELILWEVKAENRSIVLKQVFSEAGGLAYELEKTITLANDSPELIIRWKLGNRGSKTIATRHYSHNWLMLDGETRSPDLILSVFFDFRDEVEKFLGDNGFRMGDRSLRFKPHSITNPDAASFLSAPGIDATENIVRFANRRSAAAIEIVNDWSPFDFVVYVDTKGFCPESFIHLNLTPGDSRSWSTTYRFIDGSPQKSYGHSSVP